MSVIGLYIQYYSKKGMFVTTTEEKLYLVDEIGYGWDDIFLTIEIM